MYDQYDLLKDKLQNLIGLWDGAILTTTRS